MLHVDYIDNFETKALDVLRDLSAEAERADNRLPLLCANLRIGREQQERSVQIVRASGKP